MKVDGRFRSLSPEEQAATVDEIAQSPYFRAQPTKPDYSALTRPSPYAALTAGPQTKRLLSDEELFGTMPTSGVTIAPKGGIPREATPQQAAQLDYAAASAGDVGAQALTNIPSSAARFGRDILGVVSDPVGTAKTLGKVGIGTAQKLVPEQEYEGHANAVGQFFADHYGGMENLKRTMAEDPVGFLSDAATVPRSLAAGRQRRIQ